jgi:NADH-quinone oxidoreductase subunit C
MADEQNQKPPGEADSPKPTPQDSDPKQASEAGSPEDKGKGVLKSTSGPSEAETPSTKPASPKEASEKPPASPNAAGAKPAVKKPPVKRPPVKKRPTTMEADDWTGDLPDSIREKLGDKLLKAQTYRDQDFFVIEPDAIVPLLEILRLDYQFDYLVDVTAVDYGKGDKQFELVYILYSFAKNTRVRIKTRIAVNEHVASAVPVYITANWLEREVFDMFGIRFDGHPGLKRILMPEDWEGYPLRKDYGIIQQDQDWVQENLGIESGQ